MRIGRKQLEGKNRRFRIRPEHTAEHLGAPLAGKSLAGFPIRISIPPLVLLFLPVVFKVREHTGEPHLLRKSRNSGQAVGEARP